MNPILSRALLVAALCATPLLAQTALSSSVFDGAGGGPLLSGQVYFTTGHVTVPTGSTLTVQPGAIIKSSSHAWTIDGTLLCQGTAGSPVIFTSIHDDVGGDTNNNGNATSPAANQWFGLSFSATSGASVLDHTRIRCTGVGGWEAVSIGSAAVVLRNCRLSDAGNGGLEVAGASGTVVRDCLFESIAGSPVAVIQDVRAAAGFLDNTQTNCAEPFLLISDGTWDGSPTLLARNQIGGASVFASHVTVPTGSTLTLGPGVVLKPRSSFAITVDGQILSQGTAPAPVVFTSFADDTYGGDTNANGNANGPNVNQWFGVRLSATSAASTFTHTFVRCSGIGGWESMNLSGADHSLDRCRFELAGNGGVRVSAGPRPVLTNSSFHDIRSTPAIVLDDVTAISSIANNSITASPGLAHIRVNDGTWLGDVTIQANQVLGGSLVVGTHVSVPAGSRLRLGAGVVVKPSSAFAFSVGGTLECAGTASQPVVFTSIHDDVHGGDTNGNGNATAAAASQWFGLRFTSTSTACDVDHTTVRGAGVGGWFGFTTETSADVSLDHCRVALSGNGGLSVLPSSFPTVTACDFQSISGQPAIVCSRIDSVPGLLDNTASACPGGAFLRVDDCNLNSVIEIGPRNTLGNVLVWNSHVTIGATAELTLRAGLILKAGSTFAFTVNGRLFAYGPVVMTSFHDDEFGGDTNQNGTATAIAPSQWFGLTLIGTSIAACDGLLVRGSGAGGWRAITSNSANVTLARCRAERFGSGGFRFDQAAAAADLVAFAGNGNGFELYGDDFHLLRCTAAYNTGAGFFRSGTAWTGSVRSSLAFGNAAGFTGFAAGTVHYSNGVGISGGTGNINADPMFVNAGSGDLRLLSTSPCIDSGDPFDVPLGLDPFGFPRLLDGNLDAALRVDMGAFEFDHCLLLASGNFTPGGNIQLTHLSTPSIGAALLAIGLPAATPLPILNLGVLLVDPFGPFDTIAVAPTGQTNFSIPLDLAVPLPMSFQLVGLSAPGLRGNFSNAASVTIR
ncbi:MAG: choice-of-anchor Q domain-containing protein [Planctomycetota bacterium]